MSTLTVTNIKKTGEAASRDASGVAAAWANFDGTGTVAIRDSVNVSSLTDNGAGDYTVNLSNAFGGGDYAFSFGGSNYNATGGNTKHATSSGVLAASITIRNFLENSANTAGSIGDETINTVIFYGDLA